MLDALSGSKYFTVLDLKSGYHQVEITEEHKERTAFSVAPLGFYEYNRMAMGLANAPATYQRLMEECLGDLHLHICLVFLDDIIVFSSSFDEHLERVERVLDRLRDCGLKLNPKKCTFAQDRVKYVGHIVSAAGVETDPEKCEKVKNWPVPGHLRSLKKRLTESFHLAAAASNKASERQKSGYDFKARAATIEVGDRVLVKAVAFDGKHKLADRWETEVYSVLSHPNSAIPVYVVRREDGAGRKRTLHRNMLLPVSGLIQDAHQQKGARDHSHHRGQRTLRRPFRKDDTSSAESSAGENESDSDTSSSVVVHTRPPTTRSRGQPPASDDSDQEQQARDNNEAEPPRPLPDPDSESTTLPPLPNDNDSQVPDVQEGGRDEEGATPRAVVTPPPSPRHAPRASTRPRQQPTWMRSEDYILRQQQTLDNYSFKCDKLKMLLSKLSLEKLPETVVTTLIKAVWPLL
ncbi:uncharacterized protein LOC112557737 [Pomacea canaliculata]|uniref:uncharacterized protein LOC112557737 n=1 Tax=Pomacea canaliculata TaxID=400727 RepID=UPI000D73525E|nr:uncharacterized protein LOC112557737 [Pomacea canaliculata]